MKINRILIIILLSLPISLFLTQCTGEPEEEAAEVETAVYDVRGRIIFIDKDNESVTLVHEEIPDVMSAMRMTIRIDNPDDLLNIERGDIVSFQMTRRGASWYGSGFRALPEDTELNLPDILHQIDPG